MPKLGGEARLARGYDERHSGAIRVCRTDSWFCTQQLLTLTMLQTSILPTNHSDLITGAQRMAPAAGPEADPASQMLHTTFTARDVSGTVRHCDRPHSLILSSAVATASADQRIKIFQRAPSSADGSNDVPGSSSGWILQDEFRAHTSPVLKLSWSHPEFGSLIASCGYDRTVRIWEEVRVAASSSSGAAGGVSNGSQSGSGVQQAVGMNQAARDGAPSKYQ